MIEIIKSVTPTKVKEKLKKEIENIVAVKRIYIADLSKAEEHINRFKVEFERTKGNYRENSLS